MAKTAAQVNRQIADIRKRTAKVFTRTIPLKIERALTAAAVVVGNKSLEYTPIEYANLVGSQFRDVRKSGSMYLARIGYTANYAAALHNRRDWSPRPPDQKQGPAWNPNAKPGYLAAAGDETRITIRRIMLGDLRL